MARITNSFWHRVKIRWQGWSDGKKDIPSTNEKNHPHAVVQLVRRGNSHIAQIFEPLSKLNEKLEGVQDALEVKWKEVKDDYEDARKRYKQKQEDEKRDVNFPFPRAAYWTFMAVIVLAEIPFNVTVFRAISTESLLLTIIMSFVVAFSIPAAAHFIGIWIRQWPQGWITALKVIVSTSVVVAGLFALNTIRNLFAARNQYVGEFFKSGGMLEYAFFIINLLVFVVSTIASYFTHDRDEMFEHLKMQADTLSKKFQKISDELAEVRAKRDMILNEGKAKVKTVQEIINELIAIYYRANERSRKTPFPQSLPKDVKFDEPQWWEEVSYASKRKPSATETTCGSDGGT